MVLPQVKKYRQALRREDSYAAVAAATGVDKEVVETAVDALLRIAAGQLKKWGPWTILLATIKFRFASAVHLKLRKIPAIKGKMKQGQKANIKEDMLLVKDRPARQLLTASAGKRLKDLVNQSTPSRVASSSGEVELRDGSSSNDLAPATEDAAAEASLMREQHTLKPSLVRRRPTGQPLRGAPRGKTIAPRKERRASGSAGAPSKATQA
eukprot:TRINITY_DN21204_c0_g1_i4.p1 TRINITY_DN21204_c0_g1~~TRINITY_DN21204_c0_g1_i4.p1  ORF type:complete len:210 (-),score=40.78 TRINITY_DN21204_c0_g1_i4:302-931(-)